MAVQYYMDTDGVSRDFDLLAGDGRDLALGDHADGARDGLVLIVDDGAGQLARHTQSPHRVPAA